MKTRISQYVTLVILQESQAWLVCHEKYYKSKLYMLSYKFMKGKSQDQFYLAQAMINPTICP